VSRKIAQINAMNWDTTQKAILVESFARQSGQPIVILVKCLALNVLKIKDSVKNVQIGDTAINTIVAQTCVLNSIVSRAMTVNEWDPRVSKKMDMLANVRAMAMILLRIHVMMMTLKHVQ